MINISWINKIIFFFKKIKFFLILLKIIFVQIMHHNRFLNSVFFCSLLFCKTIKCLIIKNFIKIYFYFFNYSYFS